MSKKIAIIGLGYVGLPLAVEFANHYNVIGFDYNTARINQLKNENDSAEKVGLKIKDNGDLLLRKSLHNTLLVSENENYIADLSLLELGEMTNGRLLVQEIPQKIWVVKCETCATHFPTKSATAATCSQNCRKQKSLNS